MEGLLIRKMVIPQEKATAASTADTAIGFLFIAGLLVAIPFLLLWFLISALQEKLTSKKPAPFRPAAPRPAIIHEIPNTFFPLHYHYITGDEISEGAKDCFGDDEPLILYTSEPSITFFEGYFSTFKIECAQGLFAQRVIFNSTLTEVESMPLYFFRYSTQESEKILDLKDYELSIKGSLNRFKIIAASLAENTDSFELEINITDAMR